MARQLDEFEWKMIVEQEKIGKRKKERRRKAFFKKWESATPKEQAKIIWNILTSLEGGKRYQIR